MKCCQKPLHDLVQGHCSIATVACILYIDFLPLTLFVVSCQCNFLSVLWPLFQPSGFQSLLVRGGGLVSMALLAIAAFVFGLWAVSSSSSSAAISSVAGKPSEPIVTSVIPFLKKKFFPTCRVKASRFYQSYFCLLSPLLLSEFQISVCTVGPQLQVPDLSGHCPASNASSADLSSRSQ